MASLTGLQGMYPADPQDTTDIMDEGVLEAKANPPDSDHSQYGSQSLGFGGIDPSVSPFSSMGTYDAGFTDEYDGVDVGEDSRRGDQTPDTHTAPWPKGIIQYETTDPDALARAGIQITELHDQEFGGTGRMTGSAPSGHEAPVNITVDRYPAPNETYQATVTQGQLKGSGSAGRGGYGGGNADPVQGFGVLNPTEEFREGHSIRIVQHDHMPWDYTNTHGEQNVPFSGRHPVAQMPLDGPDSPYYESGSIEGGQIVWEGRIGYPTPYEQPSEPTIVPDDSGDQSDVYAWSGGY